MLLSGRTAVRLMYLISMVDFQFPQKSGILECLFLIADKDYEVPLLFIILNEFDNEQ